jgi:hypothetical protein
MTPAYEEIRDQEPVPKMKWAARTDRPNEGFLAEKSKLVASCCQTEEKTKLVNTSRTKTQDCKSAKGLTLTIENETNDIFIVTPNKIINAWRSSSSLPHLIRIEKLEFLTHF